MQRLFWGVAVMLHPFITKVSKADASLTGKDNFLFISAILGAVFFGLSRLPVLESTFAGLALFLGSLTTQDSLMMGATHQLAMIGAGLIVLSIFLKLKQSDLIYLERFFVFCSILFVAYMGMSLLGVRIHVLSSQMVASLSNTPIEIKNNWGGDRIPLGPLLNYGHDGAYLALVVPFLLKRKYTLALPVIIVGLYLQTSFAAWATAIGAVLYWGWIKTYPNKKMIPFYIAGVVMLILPFIAKSAGFSDDSGRFQIWNLALGLTTWKSFLFGNGFGWFYDSFHKIYTFRIASKTLIARHEHNEFLAIFFSFGAPMLAYAFCIIRKRIIESKNITPIVGMFAIFIDCYANFALHISPLALLVIFHYANLVKGAEYD